MVRHYGSDRSCCLPRLNLVSEAVLVQVVVSHYLLVCSLRVARTLCRRLFFQSCFFFSIKSNSVKSGSGPEHKSFSSLQRKLTYRGVGNSAKANRHSPEREALNQLCEAVCEAVLLSRRESPRYNGHVLSRSFDRPTIHSFVKFIIVFQAHYPSPFLAYSHAFHSRCQQSNLVLDRSLKEQSRTRFDRYFLISPTVEHARSRTHLQAFLGRSRFQPVRFY